MAEETSSQVPEVPRRDLARHLARIERRLEKIEEEYGREIAERMLILEGQVNYHARMSRLIAIFLSVMLAAVLVIGGIVVWKLAGEVEKLVSQGLENAQKLTQAVQLLSGLSGRLLATGGRATLTQGEIQDLRGLVTDILGSDANGFLKNLSIQNELLDELEGKKPRRRGNEEGGSR